MVIASEVSKVSEYKYPGIPETSQNKISTNTLERIKKEIHSKLDKICKSNISGKNLSRDNNKHTLAVIYYYIGVIDIEPGGFRFIDQETRQILVLTTSTKTGL